MDKPLLRLLKTQEPLYNHYPRQKVKVYKFVFFHPKR